LGEEVKYPPTLENYRQTLLKMGVQRRTLEGKMDTHVRAVKRAWVITLVDPEGELYETLIPYLDGTTLEFEDKDATEYYVVLTGLVPSGFPPVQETTITLEEA
jgi:hypothetical protein